MGDPIEARIDTLLQQMTLEEKAAFAAGSAMWFTTPIPRLGIPRMKVSDGPIGVRGGHIGSGGRSACFPNGSALAATWDPALVEAVGVALAEEARSKGVHVVLGPTVNLHRSPLGGRHFECYSEDPHLSARLAVAFVRGVQGRGVGTSVKHYVANDSEFERHTICSEVSERALRELYLAPFEAAVGEAGAWTVMAAYNRVNGPYATEHRELLVDLLKGEWGFDGLVVSDWYALKDTVGAARGGTDLEMPGPARFFGEPLAKAVREGVVPEAELDDKVRRILRVMARTGALDATEEPEERSDDRPEHRALARRAAAEAAVLLRNEGGVLPLRVGALRRLAVIGPNAARTAVQGGGSARVLPHYAVSVLEALRERAHGAFDLVHELGCTSHKRIPALDGRRLRTPDGRPGFEVAFYGSLDLSGPAVRERPTRATEHTWFGEFDSAVDPRRFSARFRGRFTPEESGAHTFALTSAGRSRLFVEGALRIDNWTDPQRGESWYNTGSTEVTAAVALEAGREVELVVEYTKDWAVAMGGLKVGHLPPLPDDLLERAVAAAGEADAAVVVVGLSEEWETEGHDKADWTLPGRQAELVAKVAAANPRTVVVLNAGGPVAMEWAESVPALLHAWYGGQEAGHAVADVLFGDADPGGRLPTTFPFALEDHPAHTGDPSVYPGTDGKVVYAEELRLGYRHFDARGVAPRFPFGHGLSYATFELGAPVLSEERLRPGEALEVRVPVRNTSSVAGHCVVQCYVHDEEASVWRPEQELRAFAKLALGPGEVGEALLSLPERAFAFWHPERRRFVAEPGAFELRIGRSSRDIVQRARVVLESPA